VEDDKLGEINANNAGIAIIIKAIVEKEICLDCWQASISSSSNSLSIRAAESSFISRVRAARQAPEKY
jgi:hypothetical protein